MEVTVNTKSDNVRTYVFDTPIAPDDLTWLDDNRHISDYKVSDRTLTVTKSDSMDFMSLENNFIIPGLKRTFGDDLKVKQYASSSR